MPSWQLRATNPRLATPHLKTGGATWTIHTYGPRPEHTFNACYTNYVTAYYLAGCKFTRGRRRSSITCKGETNSRCRGTSSREGQIISSRSLAGEPAMLVAEMQKCGRQAFWGNRGILLADAPLKGRLQNYVILVRQAALWGCQTWPRTEYILKSANTLQALQIRGMLKQKRGSAEGWLEWHKRSLRMARLQIQRHKIERWSSFILGQIWSLYGHVAREDPVTTAMLSWRGMRWWRTQQSIPVSWGGERHAQRFNPMLDTERHIVEIAGLDWQTVAKNRATWSALGEQSVAKYDVPWCTGEQLGLENLDTHRRRPEQGGTRARRQSALRDVPPHHR